MTALWVATLCVFTSIALAETVRGTAGDDRLSGTAGGDRILGKRGADVLRGRAGADLLRAGPGRDRLLGGAGADRVIGGRGRDRALGGTGADRLLGGGGPDVLVGGRGPDQFNMRNGIQLGSPGDDVIRAHDGREDQIDCGAGDDIAYVDRAGEEGVYDCERVLAGSGR